ncbi:MAG: hypothetical protein C0609_03645 [Deltaproteobacteria bacterium]|nr:MAG: hypothetical protein C0609_03645 [Deltaproteobacteria bacterium]
MERRRYPRIEINLPAKTFFSQGSSIEMEVCQLSVGGCKMRGDDLFDTSRMENISIRIGNRTIDAKPQPLYCNIKGDDVYFGVAFEKLSLLDSLRLRRFISTHIANHGGIWPPPSH